MRQLHAVQRTWDDQLVRLEPILMEGEAIPAERLRPFVRELMLVEAEEADLRRGMRAAAVKLRDTPEFGALIAKSTALFHRFLVGALAGRIPDALDLTAETTAILITSFTGHATDEPRSRDDRLRQASWPTC